MSVSLQNIFEQDGELKFTLSGVNVSIANSIRRTILSEIPVVGIYTQTYDKNECKIEKNTSRLHNEILKQRISCIPVHSKNMETLPGNYIIEVEKVNNTDNMMYVTTEDFKIKSKNTENYLRNSKKQTKKIAEIKRLRRKYTKMRKNIQKHRGKIQGYGKI